MKEIIIFNTRKLLDANLYDVSLYIPEDISMPFQMEFDQKIKALDHRSICNRYRRKGGYGLEMCLTVPLERDIMTQLIDFIREFCTTQVPDEVKLSRRVMRGITNKKELEKDGFLDGIEFSQ